MYIAVYRKGPASLGIFRAAAHRRTFAIYRNNEKYTQIIKEKRKDTYEIDRQRLKKWFLRLYGFGILYQILDMNTDNEIDDYFFGIATGLTFFNGLDISIKISNPVVEEIRPYFGISFDFDILEYLNALDN